MTASDLLADAVVKATLLRHSGTLSRTPAFHGWERGDIYNALVVGLLQRLRTYDARRGHIRAWATVAIRSAAITLRRDQMRKKRSAMRGWLSLHQPDRSGQTPLDFLRAGDARAAADRLIDDATVREVLDRLPPGLRAICDDAARRAQRGRARRRAPSLRASPGEVAAIRGAFIEGGFGGEAALSARDGRTYLNGRTERQR